MPEEDELFKDFYKEEKAGEKKSKKDKDDKEEIAINITLQKRALERTIFIVVILVLLALYLFKSAGECPAEGTGEGWLKSKLGIFSNLFKKGNVSLMPSKNVTNETKKEPAKETSKTTQPTTTKTTITSTPTPSLKKATISVDFIKAEQNTMTLTKMAFTVRNKQAEDIKPFTVRIFVYDDTTSDYRTNPRSSKPYPGGISGGGKINKLMDLNAKFNNINLVKTVKIELEDGKGEILDTAEKNCRIEGSMCQFTT